MKHLSSDQTVPYASPPFTWTDPVAQLEQPMEFGGLLLDLMKVMEVEYPETSADIQVNEYAEQWQDVTMNSFSSLPDLRQLWAALMLDAIMGWLNGLGYRLLIVKVTRSTD